MLGAGAMGCLWAARLWQLAQVEPARWARPPVRLLLRNDRRLQRWQQAGGLHLWEGGCETRLPVPVEVVSCNTDTITLLLVCTKAQDTLDALSSVRARLHADAVIVLLQNGVRVQEEVQRDYPGQRVYCLSTSHGAYMRAPYHVVHAGHGDAWIGSLPGSDPDTEVLSALPEQTMNLHWDRAIRKRLWDKFAVNCAVNALTVLHDCPNGDLLERAQAHAELIGLCEEIQFLLEALPQAPDPGEVYPRVRAVLHATAQNLSSMLQDVRAHRATEMPHLNEYLCELAQRAGLPCPRNRELLQRFHAHVPASGD